MRATLATVCLALAACGDTARLTVADGTGPTPRWVDPHTGWLPTVNIAPARGWTAGATPQAADGTRVVAFASGLDHPRWLLVLPNGDVLVAESNAPARPEGAQSLRDAVAGLVMKRAGAATPSANRITLLRDSRGTGVADVRTVLLQGLNSPFGMALIGHDLYVAETDAVRRFAFAPGQTRITTPGTVVTRLPGGPINHHWTKNLLASADGRKLYVTVGSNSNVAERGMPAEAERAAIWEVDTTTGAHRVFATGLRNPNGLAWAPDGRLWTVVNERDELGSDLVPDYLTVQLLWQPGGCPRATAAARPGGPGPGARLRAGPAHRLAGFGRIPGQCAAGAVCAGHVHRPAWLVEPQAPQWLRGGLRAV